MEDATIKAENFPFPFRKAIRELEIFIYMAPSRVVLHQEEKQSFYQIIFNY